MCTNLWKKSESGWKIHTPGYGYTRNKKMEKKLRTDEKREKSSHRPNHFLTFKNKKMIFSEKMRDESAGENNNIPVNSHLHNDIATRRNKWRLGPQCRTAILYANENMVFWQTLLFKFLPAVQRRLQFCKDVLNFI